MLDTIKYYFTSLKDLRVGVHISTCEHDFIGISGCIRGQGVRREQVCVCVHASAIEHNITSSPSIYSDTSVFVDQ